MKGLEFYPTCRLTSYPAAVSWLLADNPRKQRQRTILLTAAAVARVSCFAQFPKPQFPQGDAEGTSDLAFTVAALQDPNLSVGSPSLSQGQ